MGCGNCPEPTPQAGPSGRVRPVRGQALVPTPPLPPADPYEILTAGTTILPAGEPDLILRVAVDRLRAGLPPVLILTGQGYGRTYAAQGVQLLGPSRLERVDRAEFSVALRTTAAVEIL